MEISRFNLSNNDCSKPYMVADLGLPKNEIYIYSVLVTLNCNEKIHPHAHHDCEMFVVISGKGIIEIDNEKIEICSGDKILVNPGEIHSLRNIDKNERFVFLSLSWTEKVGPVACEKRISYGNEVLIIAPPITPNGAMHLGHLAGPYLMPDVIRRHHKRLGLKINYVCGTDDFQSYVSLKAKCLRENVEKFCGKMGDNIFHEMNNFKCSPDVFNRPLKSYKYNQFIKLFFKRLIDVGAITVIEENQPYCEKCEKWIFEAYIYGKCPNCGNACGGGSCENCAFPNNNSDIISSRCKHCESEPVNKVAKQLYFLLYPWEEDLKKYHNSLDLSPKLRKYIREIYENSLTKISVSHYSDWGIEVPLYGFNNQKIYSSFEVCISYLFIGIKDEIENHDKWEDIWNRNAKNLILTFGFDNSFFYLIVLPCIYIAYNNFYKKISLPRKFICNEFYFYNKSKFSKSSSYDKAICDLRRKYSIDILRYYLCMTRPDDSREFFNELKFKNVINHDLVLLLSNWITDVAARLKCDFKNISPDGGYWQIEHSEFISNLNQIKRSYENAVSLEFFSPRKMVSSLSSLIKLGCELSHKNKILREESCWNEYKTGMQLELTAIKYYALFCEPIMPDYSKSLFVSLGFSEAIPWEGVIRIFPKGRKIINLEKCVFFRLP